MRRLFLSLVAALTGCLSGGPADGEVGEVLPPVVPQLEWGDTDRYGAPACVVPPWPCPTDHTLIVRWRLDDTAGEKTSDYTPPGPEYTLASATCRAVHDDPDTDVWTVTYNSLEPERTELGFVLGITRYFEADGVNYFERMRCSRTVDYACEISTRDRATGETTEQRWPANCIGTP